MAIVYTHSKKSGEIFYIGIGLKNSRAYSKANRNKHWHNTVNKHGLEVNIVNYDIEWSEACKIEKMLILKYGRNDLKNGKLVNLTDGGEGVIGYNYTDEVRNKMSELKKGKPSPRLGFTLSKYTKDKISKSKSGIIFSDAHKAKISEGNKGKKLSQKHINSIVNSNKTRFISDETKLKMSLSKLNMSKKTKDKISLNSANSQIVLDLNTGVFYNSLREASKYYPYSYNTLKNRLSNKYKNTTSLIITI